MNKTFIEYLKEQNQNEILYVGTNEGSSWIIIESVETILENLERLEEIVHEGVEKQYSTSQDTLEKIPCQIVQTQIMLLRNKFENTKDKRKLEGKLCELEKKFANAYFMRKRSRNQLDNWVEIHNRKIMDIYEYDGTDEPGTCIILEGSENGTIWYKNEKKIL